ncbi:tryptophan halogenase family protein [Paraglaciecola sp.]|uniref:tryptophan halogenase family protein n=1 Tax=Paraglaciecola sp. TaxID=1920173 RepID=UPI00273DE51E|nr:tryptophan halogenase family protein [Paraglaciecola sp.]MDP5029098.1 tryptophan 7-halogenase [Paraglaciecola sp.]
MPAAKIKKIVILGGGSAGWMTAAALGKLSRQMNIQVQLIESDEIGTVGVGEATLTALQGFNRLLGIDENEFMRETQATFKLGIKFVNWDEIGNAYHHAFGVSGKPMGSHAKFYQYWLKLRAVGKAESYEHYSLNAVASEDKKFMRAFDAGNSPLSGLDHGFHIDAGLYGQYLRRLAENWGVKRSQGKVKQVRQHNNGFIRAIELEDGTEHEADFFVDCSGFNALLIGETLQTEFEDWSHWLPCDRAITVQTQSTQAPWPYTQATAQKAGWQWRIPLQHRVGNGHVYSSQYMSDEEARDILLSNVEGALLTEPRVIHFKTGYRKTSWHKNCLAIGLSSGFIEPLESTSLHLVQSAIEQLFKFFPNMDFEQADIDEYNRQTNYKIECIRNLLITHYCVTKRSDSDFWDYCRTMSVPPEVTQKIEQYQQNGRIFRFNDNMYDSISWFQVMNGQGLKPLGYDPLVDLIPEEKIERELNNVLSVIRKSADYMPSHQDFITQHCKANALQFDDDKQLKN